MSEELDKEAIVEGLLYVVGEEGLKIENIAAVMDISIEDVKALLTNIESKYRFDQFGIELVN